MAPRRLALRRNYRPAPRSETRFAVEGGGGHLAIGFLECRDWARCALAGVVISLDCRVKRRKNLRPRLHSAGPRGLAGHRGLWRAVARFRSRRHPDRGGPPNRRTGGSVDTRIAACLAAIASHRTASEVEPSATRFDRDQIRRWTCAAVLVDDPTIRGRRVFSSGTGGSAACPTLWRSSLDEKRLHHAGGSQRGLRPPGAVL